MADKTCQEGGDHPQWPSTGHAKYDVSACFRPVHTGTSVCTPLVHGGCVTLTGPEHRPVERLPMGGESNFTGEMTSQLAPSDDGSALMGSPQGRSVRLENRYANGHNKSQPLDPILNERMSSQQSRPYVLHNAQDHSTAPEGTPLGPPHAARFIM